MKLPASDNAAAWDTLDRMFAPLCQDKLMKMRTEFAGINHCAVLFLSRAAANLS